MQTFQSPLLPDTHDLSRIFHLCKYLLLIPTMCVVRFVERGGGGVNGEKHRTPQRNPQFFVLAGIYISDADTALKIIIIIIIIGFRIYNLQPNLLVKPSNS